MTGLAPGRRGAAFVFLLLFGGGLSVLPCASQPPPEAPSSDLLVPGGTAALLRAAGIHVPVEPARALLVLIRTLHGPFVVASGPDTVELARSALARAGRERLDAERIPGLLPLAVWQQAVVGRSATAGDLAGRVIADPGASFLYCGLFELDEETLRFFVAHPDLVRSVYRRSAAELAAYAGGLRIRGGRLQVPGGAQAAPAWEQALNASAADPARFVARLLEQDEGRLAALFEVLGRLDGPHLAFALGPSGRDLPGLIESVRRFNPEAQLPFVSWSDVDVPFLLEQVHVTPDGRLAPPRARRFWEAVFAGEGPLAATGSDADGDVTAPWLVDRFAATSRRLRRMRLDALLFAQRRRADREATGAQGAGDDEGWREPAASFATRQTLLLTLEEMGLVEPADYVSGAEAARAVAAGFSPGRASRRVAIFQGSIALVARCARVGSLRQAAAQALAWDMFRAAGSAPEEYANAVLERITRLLAGLPGSARPLGAEARLIDGLAGVGVDSARPVVEWEGRRYVVDLARAERARLAELRGQQGGWTLDAVIELGQAVGGLLDREAPPDRVRAAAAAMVGRAPGAADAGDEWLFGFRVVGLRREMLEAARAAGEDPARPRSEDARRRLSEGLEAVLADALVAHVYALSLDAEAPTVAGDSPGRRHDLGLRQSTEVGPWNFARVADVGPSLGVRGSLLCLDRCLARQALRSTMIGLPPSRPTLSSADVRGLAESVVALNPSRLTDEGAALLAGAVRRGRARLAAVAGQVEELETLLAAAGVDGVRRRLARLGAARGAPGIFDQLSLAEVLVIGRQEGPPVPDAVLRHWGVAARLVDGSLGQRMPRRLAWRDRAGRPGLGLLSAEVADLQIRVAEWLTELRLPALLARGVLSLAMWDLTMAAQVANTDDWLPVVRAAQALSRERFEDYVSALAAGGPLVRVATPGK